MCTVFQEEGTGRKTAGTFTPCEIQLDGKMVKGKILCSGLEIWIQSKSVWWPHSRSTGLERYMCLKQLHGSRRILVEVRISFCDSNYPLNLSFLQTKHKCLAHGCGLAAALPYGQWSASMSFHSRTRLKEPLLSRVC